MAGTFYPLLPVLFIPSRHAVTDDSQTGPGDDPFEEVAVHLGGDEPHEEEDHHRVLKGIDDGFHDGFHG